MADEQNSTASPSEAPTTPASASTTTAETDWGSVTDGLAESAAPEPLPVGQGSESPTPLPQTATPSAPAPEPPQPPVQPALQPPQPPTLAPPGEPDDPIDPAWAEKGFTALTQGYALSPELAQRYEESPSEVLPELAASVHMNVLRQTAVMMHHAIQNVVTRMIDDRLQQRTHKEQAVTFMEQRVFSRYDKMRGVPPAVLKTAGEVVRAQLPAGSSLDVSIDALARAIYGMYGWPMPGVPSSVQQSQPGATPYSPVQPGGMRPPAPNGLDLTANPFLGLLDPR